MSEFLMRCLVGLMMFVFLLGGIGLIQMAVKELYIKITRRKILQRAQGYVVNVHKESDFSVSDNSVSKSIYRFFPEIRFTKADGEAVTFRSETGESGRYSKYKIGQAIVVRYDPDNMIAPMIDSWFGIWGAPISMTFAGILLCGASVVIYFCFGAKIFGY
jgi:hypothetical protein